MSLASAVKRAVNSTPLRSGFKRILVMRPISTFNTRITVLLTSIPSALSIYKVISGPVLRILFISSQPPTNKASKGINHTIEAKVWVLRIRAGVGEVESVIQFLMCF